MPANGRLKITLSASIATGLATTFLLLAPVRIPAAATAALDAVTTPGSGTLTMCRDWLVYKSCATYHRIVVPQQVAIGDQLELDYGSNQKHYIFHVVRIRLDGAGCTILTTPGKGILVFPAHALFLRHMLSRLDHGVYTVGLLHLRIHKAPSQGRVVKFRSPLKRVL